MSNWMSTLLSIGLVFPALVVAESNSSESEGEPLVWQHVEFTKVEDSELKVQCEGSFSYAHGSEENIPAQIYSLKKVTSLFGEVQREKGVEVSLEDLTEEEKSELFAIEAYQTRVRVQDKDKQFAVRFRVRMGSDTESLPIFGQLEKELEGGKVRVLGFERVSNDEDFSSLLRSTTGEIVLMTRFRVLNLDMISAHLNAAEGSDPKVGELSPLTPEIDLSKAKEIGFSGATSVCLSCTYDPAGVLSSTE